MRFLSLLTALACGPMAFAQPGGSFVKPGSIGVPVTNFKTNSSCTFTPRSRPPITCWTGEKLLFLPNPKKERYYHFSGGKDVTAMFLEYGEAVGRIGTITGVRKGDGLNFYFDIKMDDNGDLYVGRTFTADPSNALLEGVAFLRELTDARTALKGKTVWLTGGSLLTYDDRDGTKGRVFLKRFQPVMVEDVIAGWDMLTPVRLILKTFAGQEGFVDFAYSGDGRPLFSRAFGMERVIGLSDPRLSHRWSPAIWSAFEQDRAAVGMTPEQVTYLWGVPDSVHRITTQQTMGEQWSYQYHGLVSFTNGVVTALQN